jgi:hypothetical protein
VRRFMRGVLPVAALALTIVGFAAASTYRGIEPVLMSGGMRCSDLQGVGSHSVRFSSPVNGASQDGVYLFVRGDVIDWYVLNNVPAVRAVIVKGGKDSAVYYYPYPAVHFSDAGLAPPTNPKNGKSYGLGYAEFCLSPA